MLGSKKIRVTWMVCVLAALAFGPAAMADTWSGGGGDDLWSTGANWGGTAPASGSTTALVFDGSTRLTPDQDIAHPFKFNSLDFPATAGAFALGGTVDIGAPQLGLNQMELDGTAPSITCSTTSIVVHGPITANSGTNTVTVDAGCKLQVPWIRGASGNIVVKEGSGTLTVYEHADGQRYAVPASNVGPKWRVNDGTVEFGTRADRYVQSGANWVADTTQAKQYYELTVGDGVGADKSAVVRVVAGGKCLGNGIHVKSDGWLDLNGKFDLDTTIGDLTVSGGVLSTGSAHILLRDGHKVDMNGDALIEGTANDSIWLYDASTVNVDATETRARITCKTRVVGTVGGPTFNVADKPGDAVDLEVSGKIGAGGTGGALIKNGAGTMLIHDYSYTTSQQTVNDGTLLVTGTAGGSGGSSWLVNPNGTLGGDGIINSPIIVAGGTLSPGLSAGPLTATSVELQDGSTLVWELGHDIANYDSVDLVGALTLGATLTIEIHNDHGVSVSAMDEFILFNQAPVSNASWLFDYTDSGLSGGQISVDKKRNVVVLTFGGTIPEPAGLGVLGLALLAVRRRRS